MNGSTMNPKLIAGVVFAATLVFGVFAGVVLDRTVLRPQPLRPGFRFLAGSPDARPPQMKMFSRRLDLTPEQEGKLREILENYRERFGALRMNLHPQYVALRDSLNAEIRAVLTPEQQEKFEAMMREFNLGRHHRFDRMREQQLPPPEMD
jgi:Spy/CpxP family protein refolding chaperone